MCLFFLIEGVDERPVRKVTTSACDAAIEDLAPRERIVVVGVADGQRPVRGVPHELEAVAVAFTGCDDAARIFFGVDAVDEAPPFLLDHDLRKVMSGHVMDDLEELNRDDDEKGRIGPDDGHSFGVSGVNLRVGFWNTRYHTICFKSTVVSTVLTVPDKSLTYL